MEENKTENVNESVTQTQHEFKKPVFFLDKPPEQINSKKDPKTQKFVYHIRVSCNNLVWKLHKTLNELNKLEHQLAREVPGYVKSKRKTKQLTDSSVSQLEDIGNGTQVVEHLNDMGRSNKICQNQHFMQFCEVSELTFQLSGVTRLKEGWLSKRSGGRFKHERQCFLCYCGKCCRFWTRKWFIITTEYVCYLRTPQDKEPHEVLLIDSNFDVEDTSLGSRISNLFQAQNNVRTLYMEADSQRQKEYWLEALTDAKNQSPWSSAVERPFHSFAPQRENCFCQSFVDGEQYYSYLFNELQNAESEVYITDWWLSPEVYLKRPVSFKNAEVEEQYIGNRFDRLIQNLAQRGVKIYILVYKEVEAALTLNSRHTKQHLTALSNNIKVIRHPRKVVFFWSHHEKIVIIDNKVAFLGGLDICYGRFDKNSHPLTDEYLNEKEECQFPGIDYSNSRVNDFKNVQNYTTSIIDRKLTQRMPWHDIHMCIKGPPAKDLARHFIEVRLSLIMSVFQSCQGRLLRNQQVQRRFFRFEDQFQVQKLERYHF